MNTPTDPEQQMLYHRLIGAFICMDNLKQALSEIQLFTIPLLWEEGSTELDAVADAMQGVKVIIDTKMQLIYQAIGELQNGDQG